MVKNKSKFLVLALLLSYGQSINLTLKSKTGIRSKYIEDDLDQAMDDVLMGGHKKKQTAAPAIESDADSTSPGSYTSPLPEWKAPYSQATNSAMTDPNLIKSIIE